MNIRRAFNNLESCLTIIKQNGSCTNDNHLDDVKHPITINCNVEDTCPFHKGEKCIANFNSRMKRSNQQIKLKKNAIRYIEENHSDADIVEYLI